MPALKNVAQVIEKHKTLYLACGQVRAAGDTCLPSESREPALQQLSVLSAAETHALKRTCQEA